VDPLSDVFMAMRVKTSDCVRLEFNAPWGFRFEGYEHAHFGVVTRGRCWLSLGDTSKLTSLIEGDCWLLPRGDTHTLRDQAETPVRSYREVVSRKAAGVLRYGGGKDGVATDIIIGNFTFDGQSSKWLTDVLPQLIAFRMDRGHSSAMQAILQILSSESRTESMGSAIVLGRLADILFVQAIRAHAAQDDSLKGGWLRAIRDPQMSFALRAMHEGIEKRWTVAALASSAGMSRSGFAARFKQVLGESPLEYLTRWRMYKATQLLREGDMKVAKVASLVGYESDGAFNKTFKRTIGVAPGAYRRSFV
jgi:AraC-like DNA-binding protein